MATLLAYDSAARLECRSHSLCNETLSQMYNLCTCVVRVYQLTLCTNDCGEIMCNLWAVDIVVLCDYKK